MIRIGTSRVGGRNGRRPPLTEEQIERWASAHFRRAGEWPSQRSGPVPEDPDTTWASIDLALRYGHRGLPGGSSLARLLAEQRGVPNNKALPKWTMAQVLSWAEAHLSRTGA
jgi:hypothetical protein